jgi:hypothetical protein
MVYLLFITMFVQVCLLNNKTHEPPLIYGIIFILYKIRYYYFKRL